MWISRKRFRKLEKRIADLEKRVRDQQEKAIPCSCQKDRPVSDVIRDVLQKENKLPAKPLQVNIKHPTILERMFEQRQ